MSSSSLENKIQGLIDRLRTENNSRDRDILSTVMDTSQAPPRLKPPLDLGSGTSSRKQLNLPISYQQRNIDSTDTDNKLKEIMKISGMLTIGNVKYQTHISDLELLGELGNGTCGHVVKMRHKPSGAIIAVKQMRRSGNNEENKRIIMDIDVVLKSHDCPYIVQCLGCFITETDVWICMELMATCFDKLLKKLGTAIPEIVLRKVTYATVQALSYLKEKHDVIHRDVKPSNILLDEQGNVKLCDFGISGRLVDSMAQTRSAGCAAYMAPERIEPLDPKKPDYDIRADVWSLGITLVELATGVFPYRDCKTDFEVLTKVLSEDPPSLPKDKEFSNEFRAFVAHCLIKNYKDRPKYIKLLEQPFLKKCEATNNRSVDDWFTEALRQAELLGANSPGRRYTPAPSNSVTRRHISLHQRFINESQQLSNGGSVGPPSSHLTPIERIANNSLPPDGRNNFSSRLFPNHSNSHTSIPIPNSFNHQRNEQNHLPYTNQRSPDRHLYHQSPRINNHLPDPTGRFSPFQKKLGESPPPDGGGTTIYHRYLNDSPDGVMQHCYKDTNPHLSPYQQRREKFDGFWQSPIASPLALRKHYHTPEHQQYGHLNNTSPILLQRFYHQQKQFQQQAQQAQLEADNKEDSSIHNGGKKRFASHIKLQLVGDRSSLRNSRHQSPEPPPRLSRGSSTESSIINNQSPLALRRNFLEASSAASPSFSRRYISPSPPQPPPRRLSESNSVPGSPQHFRARFHYTPEPQRRVYRNNDVS